jgi:hypothetical protein
MKNVGFIKSIVVVLVGMIQNLLILFGIRPDKRKLDSSFTFATGTSAKRLDVEFKMDNFIKQQGKPTTKQQIKGRFSRKVLRLRMRMQSGYVWGTIGVSAVSKAIKKGYRVILSRKVRKFYSKHYNIPFVVYRGN